MNEWMKEGKNISVNCALHNETGAVGSIRTLTCSSAKTMTIDITTQTTTRTSHMMPLQAPLPKHRPHTSTYTHSGQKTHIPLPAAEHTGAGGSIRTKSRGPQWCHRCLKRRCWVSPRTKMSPRSKRMRLPGRDGRWVGGWGWSMTPSSLRTEVK